MVRVCLVGAPPSTTPPTTQGQNEWSYWALGKYVLIYLLGYQKGLSGYQDSTVVITARRDGAVARQCNEND